MKTEEYPILILAVATGPEMIDIQYRNNSNERNVSLQVLYSNGQTIKIFDQLKKTEKDTLNLPSQGLLPGTYTCNMLVDGKIRNSKSFPFS